MKYYVYGHYTKDSGRLFYIGKGTGNRAWRTTNRSKAWHDIVTRSGYTYKILQSNLDSNAALLLERELIIENKDSVINSRLPTTVNTYSYDDISNMFYYDKESESGLRWKVDRLDSLNRVRKYKDKMAGSKNDRYWCVEYMGKSIPVHRIIFFLSNPDMDWELDVDHINGNGFDNRVENLRLVDKSTNMKNRILPNKTGNSYVSLIDTPKLGRKHYLLKIPVKGKRQEYRFYFSDHITQLYALHLCLKLKEEKMVHIIDSGVTERAFYGKN